MAFVDLNDTVIDRVRQAADIVEVVSQVTPLKPAGTNFKGLCPFHREKTPSFNVSRDKGVFYCFGCGEGGDVFKFVILAERMTFPEAVEHVASRVGIELPRKEKSRRDEGKEDLYAILEEAAEAFHQALQWKPNVAARYLEERAIDEDLWRAYGLGYAPDSWDYLLTRLGRRYPAARLEQAGLALPRKNGNGHYDRFRSRLIVPIHNEGGTLVGFGGRTLDGSDPKYLNSPESAVFDKSKTLYNYHRVKDQIRRLDRAILVEGYFDCIALDSAGIDGVVASMGTSLTPGQASLLRKRTDKVLIAYDGDDAGRKAALRAAPVLLSAGLSVGIIDVGAGEDPDSLIRKEGYEAFLEAMGNATDVIAFALAREAAQPSRMTAKEKSEAVERMQPLIAAIADPVIRNDAAQRVAERLQLEFDTVWSGIRAVTGPAATRIEKHGDAPVISGEKQVLAAALAGTLETSAIDGMDELWFQDDACRSIFRLMKEAVVQGQTLDFHGIQTHLRGDAEIRRLSELGWVQAEAASVTTALKLMERRHLERRLRDTQRDIQEAEREGNHARLEQLVLEKTEVVRRLHALK